MVHKRRPAANVIHLPPMVLERFGVANINRQIAEELGVREQLRHRPEREPAEVTIETRHDDTGAAVRERERDFVLAGMILLLATGAAFGIASEEVAGVEGIGAALGRAREANDRGEPRIVVWRERLFPPRTTSPRWHE